MKVLFVIPKLHNGGIEKIASSVSLNLSEEYNQIIYSIMSQSESYDFKVEPIVLDRLVVNGLVSKLKNFYHRVMLLRRVVTEQKIDIVLSFGERCNIITMLSGVNIPKILTVHSQISKENSSKGAYGLCGSIFAKLLYRNADFIVSVSKVVQSDLKKFIKLKNVKLSTIYNGHDIANINRLALIDDSTIPKVDFISVGRITFAKGHFHLLRSLSIVKRKYPDVKLNIVGDYEELNLKRILDDVIFKYDLKDNVSFSGYQGNPYKYMKQAKALVLPSIYEGFPGVVIESLSLGIPVIATNCGGATEIITDEDVISQNHLPFKNECGVIVSEFDGKYDLNLPLSQSEHELANVMIELLDENHLFSSDKIKEKVSLYSIKSMIKSYELLLKEVFNERGH